MIIGHKKQQELLKKILNSEKIPHALLFSGPEKLGKKTIALHLISSVFKEELSRHPDFILIEPEKSKIQIRQIRDLNWKLSLKPIKAPLFGAIIDQAHLMTREAQNCFLKTLEEPKSKSLLILATEHPSLLFPTILSRCETIKFYPVGKEEIGSYLKEGGASEKKIKDIVDVSLGRPGNAVDFLKDPQKLNEREKKVKDLVRILSSPVSLRFKYAEELSKNNDLKNTLTIWLSYFRKLLINNKNQTSFSKTKSILELLQKTIFLISNTNVNPRLALEVLMLEF
ncbi:MAG: hypothetical protein KJI71_02030 [Patescibacteria group bacterium]|nr:hypothetical protein [Patescibacteria group bacterium]